MDGTCADSIDILTQKGKKYAKFRSTPLFRAVHICHFDLLPLYVPE